MTDLRAALRTGTRGIVIDQASMSDMQALLSGKES
jgi:hypothetical protein